MTRTQQSLLLLSFSLLFSFQTVSAAEDLRPRLILVGDSTVKCGRANGENSLWGWGQVIGQHFDRDRIKIENHALGGRSSRTFFTERLWEKALQRVRPGDFVLIQFGHNDGGDKFKGDRPRASIKGNGEESVEGVVESTGKNEVVHSYGWYLRKYVSDAKEKGATPIVLSLVARNRWKDGQVIRSDRDYAKWAKEAAAQSGALFIDLNELVASQYEQLGREEVSREIFTKSDWTHTKLAGAKVNAECVVEGIKSLQDCPLASYLKQDEATATSPAPLRFGFGAQDAITGDLKTVTAEDVYDKSRGYGFEPGAEIACSEIPEGNRKAGCGCESSQPFYFSVALPEGNYRVKVTGGEYPLTVKAELRRLYLWETEGTTSSPSVAEFTVNVRTPRIDEKKSVRLKPRERETEAWAWDEKLTLEFNGPHPCVSSLTIEPDPEAMTVFLAGDSTVTDQPFAPWNSWGQMLPYFFAPSVCIANHSESGESIASSLGAGRFDKIFSLMKPGDHLLIQFGHNDMKSKAPDALERYRRNLVSVVERTHELGGVPVLITSMERRPGGGYASLGDYPQAMREIAAKHHVPLIDLNAVSRKLYEAMGEELPQAFQDVSHHTVYGSYELAQCVVQGIIDRQLTLAGMVNDRFAGFDPARPDAVASVRIPTSPQVNLTKPDGS